MSVTAPHCGGHSKRNSILASEGLSDCRRESDQTTAQLQPAQSGSGAAQIVVLCRLVADL